MTKYKIAGNSSTCNIMLYKVDEKGDPIELGVTGHPILYLEEHVIEELRAEGVSKPKSAYFKLVDDLCKEARKKGATGDV
jgi:hypothetical protein